MTELIRIALLLGPLAGAPVSQTPGVAEMGVPREVVSGIINGGGTVSPVPLPPDAVAAEPARPYIQDAWLGSDKFQHFGMSYAVTAFTFGVLRAAGADADAALTAALPVAAAAGVGKELYDRRRGTIFSVRDLVADGLGITAAYFFLREVR